MQAKPCTMQVLHISNPTIISLSSNKFRREFTLNSGNILVHVEQWTQ